MERDIENKEWMSQAPYLAKLKQKADDFIVPDGYFENLSGHIQASIVLDQLKSEVAESGYTVPPNYFEQLQFKIIEKTQDKNLNKTVKLWQTNFFKYAASACLIVISTFLLYTNEPDSKRPETGYTDLATEQMLFDIDEQVIIDHIQNNQAENISYKGSDAELENYILTNFSQNDLTSE